jgi:hypothetical protein
MVPRRGKSAGAVGVMDPSPSLLFLHDLNDLLFLPLVLFLARGQRRSFLVSSIPPEGMESTQEKKKVAMVLLEWVASQGQEPLWTPKPESLSNPNPVER